MARTGIVSRKRRPVSRDPPPTTPASTSNGASPIDLTNDDILGDSSKDAINLASDTDSDDVPLVEAMTRVSCSSFVECVTEPSADSQRASSLASSPSAGDLQIHHFLSISLSLAQLITCRQDRAQSEQEASAFLSCRLGRL